MIIDRLAPRTRDSRHYPVRRLSIRNTGEKLKGGAKGTAGNAVGNGPLRAEGKAEGKADQAHLSG